MNLERLLNLYLKHPKLGDIVEELCEEQPSRLLLKGLIGAQEAFIIASVFNRVKGTHLIIAQDKEDAAYLQNNLEALVDQQPVLFFPDSFRRPGHFEEINRNNVLQRTETVSKLVLPSGKGQLLVTYPEALFEKVVAPLALKESAIEIAIKEELDVEFLTEVLVEYGFERVDFVYEPGQFSIRGGIIDIYSYGHEYPYRIDLFDEEVESIRTFNPNTQLSDRKIAKVTIVPNINTRFESDQKTSLLRILDPGSKVWIKDASFFLDRLQECFEQAKEYGKKLESLIEEDRVEEAKLIEERAFILPKDVMADVKGFHILEMGNTAFTKRAKVTQFNAQPQPSFNKNFDLLVNNLKENEDKGISNYLFAGNSRQIKRFYSIFEDLDATLEWHPVPNALHNGFIDQEVKIACYTDHQIFERYHKYQIKKGFDRTQALNLKRLRELQPGDYVTHIDHGVGKYSGLEKININGNIQESVRLFYRDSDVLYVSINSLHKISKYVGKDGTPPKIHKLGSDTWANTKRKTKKKVKELALDLIQLYAKRKATPGFAYEPDGYLQAELEASFIYEDTPDQAKATEDVKADMQKDYPMDRLVCGDVGFGKTEVAIRAAFKAVVSGKQVAILVPTTILALQHAKTFGERLKEFGVRIDYLNRFRTAKEKTQIYKKVEAGEVDILIGTHAILNKRVVFKDLGLLVIDEEQKFGVGAKEKIRSLRVNVDTLTLTATPIPRTLQFSLMAARDLSVINTPPPNRQPIQTEIRTFDDEVIKEAIYFEVYRGGQVFFLHNRVKQLADITAMVQRVCPDLDIASAHGQMDSKVLEERLINFIDGKYDVLVCTNIIETGLDIPNANTIIINNAHHFGLSDLHQLRGRVGRSNKKAFCYLFCPPLSTLTSDARKRLKTIEEFSELGSGFKIAMKDLDIRGAGNLLGGEQSGFITDMGYETYQKILEESIQELKETEFKELFKEDNEKKKNFVRDVQIDTDIEMLIPDDYINNIQERLNLYTELNQITTEEGIEQFSVRLNDRFGRLPKQVKQLFDALRLQWICKELGFERIILKNNKLRCYFISNPDSSFFESSQFKSLMQYIQLKSDHRFRLKQTPKYLILACEEIKTLKGSITILSEVREGMLAIRSEAN